VPQVSQLKLPLSLQPIKRKKNMTRTFVTTLLLFSGLVAYGTESTQNKSTPRANPGSTAAPLQQILAIDKFDPALGILKSVTVTVKCVLDGTYFYENTTSQVNPISGKLSAECSNDQSTLKPVPLFEFSEDVPAYDQDLDFGGTSGFTSPTITTEDSATSGELTDDTTLAMFTGSSGTVDFTISSVGKSIGEFSSGGVFGTTSFVQTTVTVVYKWDAPVPTVTKSFSATSTEINQDVVMSITITNNETGFTMSGVNILDAPPNGMEFNTTITPTLSSQTDCGAGASVSFASIAIGTQSSQALVFTGGILAPGGSCTIEATVRMTVAATLTNTTSEVCANTGCGTTASASLTGTNPPPPPPPPSGNQGCSPGFWRNANISFWDPGFKPTDSVKLAFNAVVTAFPNIQNTTFAQALRSSGNGGSPEQAALFLLRSATAALKNIENTSISYPRAIADLQSQVNTAIGSKLRNTMNALTSALDQDNNLGCPISSGGN